MENYMAEKRKKRIVLQESVTITSDLSYMKDFGDVKVFMM